VSRLQLYVQGWREAAADLRAVADELDARDWDRPTDCPGWSVRDVLAHLVAIEEHLAGIDTPEVPAGERSTGRVVTAAWTQVGVDARRDRPVAGLLADLDAALAAREQQLRQELAAAEPAGRPARLPAGLAWDWDTLLRNRAIDMWVHGQDIRRAVERPGGMDNAGAAVTLGAFAMALPFVIGKLVRPPAGASVVFELSGAQSATIAVGIDDQHRGVQLSESPAEPTVRLAMDAETFAALAAGRRDPVTAEVTVHGDPDLARRTLASMAVTP